MRIRLLLAALVTLPVLGLSALLMPATTQAGDDTAKGPADPELAKQAKEILQNSCFACHGQYGEGEGKLRVLEQATYDDASLRQSIRDRITGDETPVMPPKRHKDGFQKDYQVDADHLKAMQLSAEQKGTLVKWLDAGARLPQADRAAFHKEEAMFKAIKAYVESQPETKRANLRFLTLHTLANTGDTPEELAVYRKAIIKTLNSLSWNAKVQKPTPVPGTDDLVYAFDLSKMGPTDKPWTAATWDAICEFYPYDMGGDDVAVQRACKSKGTLMMRADFFVFFATLPTVYHDLLGVPGTVKELEKILGVDTVANAKSGDLQRAGVTDSGVSVNHRVVERHELDRWNGYYWKSYDFKHAGENAPRLNITKFPVPKSENAEYGFEESGGEFVFTLPNGFQGYMIADDKGNRLDVAPASIVTDNASPRGEVHNGFSCIQCHAEGVKSVKSFEDVDRVRELALRIEDETLQRQIETLHPTGAKMKEVIGKDVQSFLKAMAAAGAGDAEQEPVRTLIARFRQRHISLAQAAAELGMEGAALEAFLKTPFALNNDSAQEFGSLLKGKGLSRKNFIVVFKELRRNFGGHGAKVKTAKQFDDDHPPVLAVGGPLSWAKCEKIGDKYVNGQGSEFMFVPSGTFQMGSPAGEVGRFDNETQRVVDLSRVFLMGRTEVTQKEYQALMGENPSRFKNAGENSPVETVNWYEAKKYCEKLTEKERVDGRLPAGWVYRLPTEAEWEYACRAGTTTSTPAGELEILGERNGPILDGIAWCGGNSGVAYEGAFDSSDWKEVQHPRAKAGTHPVAQKKANAWGLCDMLGNVTEWTASEYDSSSRVVRGGNWFNFVRCCRSAFRNRGESDGRYDGLGFRMVCASVLDNEKVADAAPAKKPLTCKGHPLVGQWKLVVSAGDHKHGLEELNMRFTEEGRMETVFKEKDQSVQKAVGTWVPVHENEIEIRSGNGDGEQGEKASLAFSLLGDTLTMTAENESQMFTRVK